MSKLVFCVYSFADQSGSTSRVNFTRLTSLMAMSSGRVSRCSNRGLAAHLGMWLRVTCMTCALWAFEWTKLSYLVEHVTLGRMLDMMRLMIQWHFAFTSLRMEQWCFKLAILWRRLNRIINLVPTYFVFSLWFAIASMRLLQMQHVFETILITTLWRRC